MTEPTIAEQIAAQKTAIEIVATPDRFVSKNGLIKELHAVLATLEAQPAMLIVIDHLAEALQFYADPESYFALMIVGDSPCGQFIEDFSDDHEHPQLDGDRYGKRAREALRKAEELLSAALPPAPEETP